MNNNEYNYTLKKVTSIATAATFGAFMGTTVFASDRNMKVSLNQEESMLEVGLDSTIDSLYQQQMNYLVTTQKRLQDFFEKVDTKGIIKTAFPLTYSVAYADLNCQTINYGPGAYKYISNNPDLLAEIEKNNTMISTLRIQRSGNSRDTDYGLIADTNSLNGFRLQTEEDRQLIKQFTQVVGYRYLISDSLLNLLSNIKNNNYIDEQIYNDALDDIYQNQMSYLNSTQKLLQDFYKNVDTQGIIKNGYPYAYNAAFVDLNCEIISYGTGAYAYISNNPDLLAEIVRNEKIISLLRIKAGDTARDTDYGVIIDPSVPVGIRFQTAEDKKLINEYTDRLGIPYSINQTTIQFLSNIQTLQNYDSLSR